MYKQYGFGALLDFRTLGLGKMRQAGTELRTLGKTVDVQLIAMQRRIANFAAMTFLGGAMLLGGGGMLNTLDGAVALSQELEDSSVRLRGKLQELSDSDFSGIVHELRAIGRVTEYTESQVIDAANANRALGASAEEVTKVTGAALTFATAMEEMPDTAGRVLSQVKNAFGRTADEIVGISDMLAYAMGTTAWGSSELGILEFSHLAKNIAKFKDSIPIEDFEAVAVGSGFRAIGMSAELAGNAFGQLGQAFARIEQRSRSKKILDEWGLSLRDIDGRRKSFMEMFEVIGRQYNELYDQGLYQIADTGLEKLLGLQAGYFRTLLAQVEAHGDWEGYQKFVEGFNALNVKGYAETIQKMKLATYTGNLKVAKGLWDSIRSTVGVHWLNIKKTPLIYLNGLLNKLSGILIENKGLAEALAYALGFGGIAMTAAGGILLLTGALGMMINMGGGLAMLKVGMTALLGLTWKLALVGVAVAALTAGVWLLWKHWDNITNWMAETWDTLWTGIVDTVKGIGNWLRDTFNTILLTIVEFIAGLVNKTPEFILDLLPNGRGAQLQVWADQVESEKEARKQSTIQRGNDITPEEALRLHEARGNTYQLHAVVEVNGDISTAQKEALKTELVGTVQQSLKMREIGEQEKR